MKILITSNSFSEEFCRILEAHGFDITRNPHGRLLSEEELAWLLRDKDAVILSTDPLSARVIDACDHLKVVSRYGTGINNVDVEALKRKGIALETAAGANKEAVADHAVGLMLALSHNIVSTDLSRRNGSYRKEKGRDLYGSTVGILGLGAVGRGIAERLKGFKCRILAYDVCWDEEYADKMDIRKADPETIFREGDFISLNMPGSRELRNFVSRDLLSLMRPGAYLINTARSDLVDREALFTVLVEGRIGGYGADVSWKEPEVDEEFRKLENVIITPHNAAVTEGAIRRMSEMAVNNVLKHFE